MQTLSPSQLRSYLSSHPDMRYTIVDVRSPDEFRHEHIENSINIPLDTVLSHVETLRNYEHVFLYCRSGNRSGQACATLHGANIPHATSIEGGIAEMERAGFSVLRTKGTLPLLQQVLLSAGSLVVTGIVLSVLLSPWFSLLSLGVGIGLMYAGISGNCMLSVVLARMPWNRSSV